MFFFKKKKDKAPQGFVERRNTQPDVMAGPPRRYDNDFKAYAIRVEPQSCAIAAAADEMLVTVVGGCAAVCIRDVETGIGGMAHFMLPIIPRGSAYNFHAGPLEMRAGHVVMEKLLALLASRGASRARMEVKIFGGASLVRGGVSIADETVAFARRYLREEKIAVFSEDTGGLYPRRLHFFPSDGRLFCLALRRAGDAEVFQRELELRDRLHRDIAKSPQESDF
jgi:chemotaxis protein CheD